MTSNRMHVATTQLQEPLALQAAESVPDWIHILPAGTFSGVDGRGPYIASDPSAIIAASLPKGGRPIPLDYNHATIKAATHGGDAPAAGWIVAMQARQDGIWAEVEWTPAGKDAVKERQYRYVSPGFATGEGGKVTRIDHVSLTNRPNIADLLSLNTQNEFALADQVIVAMREDMAAIRMMTAREQRPVVNAQEAAAAALDAEIKRNLGLK